MTDFSYFVKFRRMVSYRQPSAPTPELPRHTQTKLPLYRFIPGLSPHPRRDPLGHAFNHPETKLDFIDPQEWQKNHDYLYGIDLYNNAYWWESHEAWESVWHTTDKASAYGQYLQGLIQISAAFIKWFLNQHEGLVKLYTIGIGRLEFVAARHKDFMGLDVVSHVQKVKAHFAGVVSKRPATWPEALANYPHVVLTGGPHVATTN